MDEDNKIVPFPRPEDRPPGRPGKSGGADVTDMLAWRRENFRIDNSSAELDQEYVDSARRKILEALGRLGKEAFVKDAWIAQDRKGPYVQMVFEQDSTSTNGRGSVRLRLE